MELTMPDTLLDLHENIDLARFEGLGNNCEFGFVCRKLQNEGGSFFRWTQETVSSVCGIIEANFANIYAFENLEPRLTNMIRDTFFDISFHSAIRSVRDAQGQLVWEKPEDWRREKHAEEYQKVRYLIDKFTQRAKQKNVCYVIKSEAEISDQLLSRMSGALENFAGHDAFSLVVIGLANAAHQAGTVISPSPCIHRGFVNFFAPGDRADHVDIESWVALLNRIPLAN
jgi:hypothetical protein